MNKDNLCLAGIFFLVGLGLYFITPSQVSQISTAPRTLSAAFFPKFVSFLMMFSSLGLFIQTLGSISHGYESEAAPEHEWSREIKVVVVLIMMILYTLLMDKVGFIISTLAFGWTLLGVLGSRKPLHYGVYTVCVGIIYVVFKMLLYVHLPAIGLWIF